WRGKNCCSWHRLSPGAKVLITGEPPKQAEDRKKPNPSACTGLAEHLLPQRHELIQSFPRTESGHRIGFDKNLLDGYSVFTKFHHFLDSLSNVIGHIYLRYLPSTHRVCFLQKKRSVPYVLL